jgi:hypothetical protein
MRKVSVFNFVALDGYLEGPKRDISWHRHVMVDPVVLGDGTPIFKNIKHKLDLKLTRTRTFKSGVVLLCCQPVEKA